MKHEKLTEDTKWLLPSSMSRRDFVRAAGAMTLLAGMEALVPGYARAGAGTRAAQPLQPLKVGGAAVYDLRIARTPFEVAGRPGTAITINGTVPGPLLRFREGGEAVIRVHNELDDESTSIHWHGLIVPNAMDGVPGVNFAGIAPGEVFEYRFPLKQYGTYWYHSHTGLQEQLGHRGPLIIDPAAPAPIEYDREYVVMLGDWTFEDPWAVLAHMKNQADFYNFQKLTVADFFESVAQEGLWDALKTRLNWGRMRMDRTDILDVTGATYTYLMNGLAPDANWTGLFRPGERVRLRFINAGTDTFFDVRIPGLDMTVVQYDGQWVQPVETHEFRIAVAETYDVIVEPTEDRAYTIFAEVMDRSGYARGTLAPRPGMEAPVPELRPRPLLSMAAMGMMHGGMEGMNHGGMDMEGMDMEGMQMPDSTGGGDMEGMESMAMQGGAPEKLAIAGAVRTEGLRPPGTVPPALMHGPDGHGPGNATTPMMTYPQVDQPGVGLGDDGWPVLVYTDLRALERRPDFRPPDRSLEIHLTGNMERFMWSINGEEFSNAAPIPFNYGERLRLIMVNDTMMNHPMHLHGMWMELENGHGELIPRSHTVNVKPAERLSLLINVDALGPWAFHCHILYHMESGMFRVVRVSSPEANMERFYYEYEG